MRCLVERFRTVLGVRGKVPLNGSERFRGYVFSHKSLNGSERFQNYVNFGVGWLENGSERFSGHVITHMCLAMF